MLPSGYFTSFSVAKVVILHQQKEFFTLFQFLRRKFAKGYPHL